MKKSGLTFLAVLTVSSLALSTASCSSKKDKEDENQSRPVIDVAMPVVDTVTIYKSYPGYLTAKSNVDLVARVSGYLVSHPYKAGDKVAKGQVLFTIESGQYVDAVNQAKAQLDNAVAQHEYYAKNYEAMQKAFQSDAVSRMEVLQAQSNMETSQASINSAKAALETARMNLGYCTVRAPFAGKVTATPYSDGAFLDGAGSPVTLAQIYDDSFVTANFNIDDNELIALVNSGNYDKDRIDLKHIPIEFGDTLPHKYTADLSYMSPVLDVSTGQMVVQANIDNKNGELRPGMVTTVKFPTNVVPDAILIEDAAISKDQLGSYVYVVNDSDKVVYTPVSVGDLVTPTMRLVTKGIKPGDRYVTKALLKVRDGMSVSPRLQK